MPFRLQPTHYGTEPFYGCGAFKRTDVARMAKRSAQIKGSFIPSTDDHPAMREIFVAFAIEA
ncbi:hypothetical protein [Aureimonas pseudogalii]|uniref:Uncharacterized protein n=1 Tax=Aureimonas pseudogalii TaxID=1744844 RepID=A0A7W6E984_9HYPH|nr:hypothetical protein [Aureimonas pseudogalii]MBB3997043.1 hypothetical protein [Aureimonas pseudogalii]